MRLFKPLIFALLMAVPALAQIPAPQISLGGNIGCMGFPCLNSGTLIFTSDANHTITAQESSATGGIKITSSVSLTATRNLILPTGYGKLQFVSIENATTGGQSIIIIGQSGTGITIPTGQSATGVWFDGTNVIGTLSSGGGGVSSFNTRTGAVTPISGDYSSFYCLLTGCTYTGNVTFNGSGPQVTLPETTAPTTTSGNQYLQAIAADHTTHLYSGATDEGPLCSASNAECGGGGTSNPVICTANSTNVACLGIAPYNAYGLVATQTTSSTTAGTTVAVATCAPFAVAGTGLLIPGAGAGAANYTGVSVTCSGTTLTLGSSTTTTVPAGTAVQQTGGTTTSGTFGVGTSGTVASCATFSAGNGVFIAGAGAAGVNYLGKVVSCIGTTLTLNATTSTSVAGGTLVQHDESAALQAALTAMGSTNGGDIYFPCGAFLLNGNLQNTGTANDIVQMPSIEYGLANPQPIQIALHGCAQPTQLGIQSGSILQSSLLAGGNAIGGYNASGPFGTFTNVYLTFDNMTLRGPANPPANSNFLNAQWIAGLRLTGRIWCDTGILPLVTPTHSGSACIVSPNEANSAFLDGEDVFVGGWYLGLVTGEHLHIRSYRSADNVNGITIQSGAAGQPQNSNGVRIDHEWDQGSANAIASSVGPLTTLTIGELDCEAATTSCISDSGNLLRGTVHYHVPYTGGAVGPHNPATVGAANLNICDLDASDCGIGTTISVNQINFPATSSDVSITHPGANELEISSAATTGAFLLNVLQPNLAANQSTYGLYGKSFTPHNVAIFDWTNDTTPFAELSTYNYGDPVRAAGSQIWLNGGSQNGPVFINNANANGGATLPSACTNVALAIGTVGQHCIDQNGNTFVSNTNTSAASGTFDNLTNGTAWLDLDASQALGGNYIVSAVGTYLEFGSSTSSAVNNPGFVGWANLTINGWNDPSGTLYAWNSDTGLSRCTSTPNCVAVGNGTAGDTSGTVKAATGTFGTAVTVGGNNVCQSTGTNCPATTNSHNDTASIQGALFATNTILGAVFYEPVFVTYKSIIARLSGTISCTTAPTVGFYDLGTSPSTIFSGVVGSVDAVTTGTSDGVYQHLASVNMVAGHYYGFAFSGGTCVTAPTFDLTATVQ